MSKASTIILQQEESLNLIYLYFFFLRRNSVAQHIASFLARITATYTELLLNYCNKETSVRAGWKYEQQ